MKTLILVLLCIGSVFGSLRGINRDTLNHTLQVVQGFFKSLNQSGNINNTCDCVNKIPEIVIRCLKVYDRINNGTYNDTLSMLDFIAEISDSVKELSFLLKPCYLAYTIDSAVYNNISFDQNDILNKFLKNAMEIFSWFTSMISAMKKQVYPDVGTYLGNIAYCIFLDPNATQNNRLLLDKSNAIIDFIRGLLEGINEKRNIEELLLCIEKVEPVLQKIMEAIELILNFNLQDIIEGVKMFVSAIKELMKVLEPCSKGYEQIEKLIKEIANTDLNIVIVRVLGNYETFLQLLNAALSHFLKKNFKELGLTFGKILEKLFLESHNKN